MKSAEREPNTPFLMQGGVARRAGVLAAAMAVLALPVHAQIVLDGTLGRPTPVLTGPNYAISANVGRQVGGNLFHSFSQFNVLTDQSATFSGPGTVNNIIGRVTGGSASTMDGLMRSTIAGANLYFINPSGIVFGPNAQLAVSGSFHASSAHYLALGSGGRFDAVTPAASALKAAAPSAFGFLGPPTGPITVNNALLRVPDGKGLSLVGGAITANVADLIARGGRVDLAAVASAGKVTLAPAGITATGVTAYAPVTLDNTFVVTNSMPGHSPQGLSIRGGVLTLSNGSQLLANTAEPGPARGVTLDTAGPLVMNGGAISARTVGAGRGGDIVVRANGVTMTGGAFIESNTSGSGTGGDLTVQSTGPVRISGATPFRTGLYASTSGAGDAGALRISAPALTVEDGGLIHSHASAGRGADITIEVGQLTLARGGRIESQTQPFSTGRSGDIIVRATGDVTVSGRTTAAGIGDPESAIVTDGLNGSAGQSGTLLLNARDVSVSDGGLIATQMFDAAGGDVTLNVRRLTLASGGAVASDLFTGITGGALAINASESVAVNAGGEIRSFSAVSGTSGAVSIATSLLEVNGGRIGNSSIATTARNNAINISADRVLVANGGNVYSRNSAGTGGAVTVNATREVRISDPVSAQLLTQVTDAGTAGAMTINTPLLVVEGGGFVGTIGTGGASGDLTVRAGRIELSGGGQIDSSTFGGIGSLVDIVASEAILITAPPTLLDAGTSIVGGILGQSFHGGTASTVRLSTPALIMNGGNITTTSALGGNGGDIEIRVGRLSMTSDASITATSQPGSARGGNILIRASDSITIGPNPYNFAPAVSTEVSFESTGDAGSIRIGTPHLTLQGRRISSAAGGFTNAGGITLEGLQTLKILDGGSITTQALLADGGDIHITARDLVYLRDSRITTAVNVLDGSGGNILIDPTFVVLDNSQLIASASAGNGGRITIISDFFLRSPDSLIDATSRFGVSGTVTVSAPNVDVSAGLAVLPSAFFDASSMMRESCAARAGHAANSFTGAARGGLPAGPEHFGFGAYSEGTAGALAAAGGGGMAAATVQLACLR